ncbi:unnamed protein product [Psylliodes chrysocephalus]|uniref:Uncharacterized protein n=1 Tax=Psylliodes chrysocephalus TaxID=3402493 RepID=A0A9P0D1G0_9CUCU|nr:unnamed protein product [Psylliodes chrysocephala]
MTVPESHVGSSYELDLMSNKNSPEEGVLEDQDEEDPFAASDEDDEEYDPNIEDDNNSDTSEDTEELRYSDFFDFKVISQAVLKNRTVNTEWSKVKWLQVKCFRIEKDNPGVVKYKYNHSDDYLCINISGRGRPSTSAFELNKTYSAMLPISIQKYNDFKKLCTNEAIPSEFHQWYLLLLTSTTVKNRNAEPSVDSESEED